MMISKLLYLVQCVENRNAKRVSLLLTLACLTVLHVHN